MQLFCYYRSMISHLSGNVLRKDRGAITLDIHGVGYSIHVLPELLKKIKEGEKISLFTYLSVRENSMDLYGFIEKEELDFFGLLVSISGIGPKSALSIISLAPPETLARAIISGDTTYLTKVSGIGKKMADKIVLELKNKMKEPEMAEEFHLGEEGDIIDALRALGYKQAEAREALKQVPKDISGTSERIKEALKLLGK